MDDLEPMRRGGANPNGDNLDPKRYTDFANYLAEVVGHFRKAWGISFNTLDPMNEPFTDYWRSGGNQEGCHFDRSSQCRLVRLLRDTLDRRGLESTTISAADETSYVRAIGTWNAYDAKTRDCVACINAHGYDTRDRVELRVMARSSGKPLIMSEVDGSWGANHDDRAIGPAIGLAGQIVGDLRDLQPQRWVLWQAVEDEAWQARINQNWGLIHADLAGSSHTWNRTKKFYAMANFSRFIRPGAVLVPSDASETVAAIDRRRMVLVIVTRNAERAVRFLAYDVSPFGSGSMRVDAYRTSATQDLAELPSSMTTLGKFSDPAPPQSVTTYVVKLRRAPLKEEPARTSRRPWMTGNSGLANGVPASALP